jgi:PAS domain S-box-containing protein
VVGVETGGSALTSADTGEALNAYLEAALDAVILADASGRVLEFNAAAERMFGYRREQALGTVLGELIVPPSLRERHTRGFARFAETGEGRVFGRRLELTGMRSDGSEFPVELALSCVHGEPLLVCGAIRDLTDAKRAEGDLRRLADEQAALRRVATLVADEAAPDLIFASVAEEIARILMADRCAMGRFETDDSMTVVAYWSNEEAKVPVGTQINLEGDSVTAAVRESRRPILIDDHEAFSGPLIDYARTLGSLPRSTVAAPIFVEGRIWGSIFASTMAVEVTEGTEARVVDFAELVATAIANTEAQRELERIAAEQQALRTAATLVASGASETEVFAAITTLASELFEVPFASLLRYGPDETATMVAGCAACSGFVGQAWTVPGDDPGIVRTVVDSRRPARIEDHSGVHGPLGQAAHSLGVGSVVGAPVIVDGSVWGVLAVGAALDGPSLPADAGDRLVGFTELVTTTLINAETRDGLRRLADEQAGLRHVATLAARESSPVEVLDVVAEEAARVLEVDAIGLLQFDSDDTATLVAQSETPWDPPPLGTRFTLEGENLVASVHRTGQSARMDDWETATGSVAAMATVLGVRSAVACPILVEGRLWGTMVAATNQSEPLPPDTESRIVEFAELLATAISNAESRAELAASEAHARGLAEQQAALRRVATLVAQGASPAEVFRAVADEIQRLLEMPFVVMSRYDSDGLRVVGAVGKSPFVTGTRWPLDGPTVSAEILRTGRPVRVDYADLPGTIAESARAAGFSTGVGAPVVVDGAVWGAIVTCGTTDQPLSSDVEARLVEFTQLVATAISNVQARDDLRTLAREQAALRRVATLAASGAQASAVFDAVCEEAGRLLNTSSINLSHYTEDGFNVTMAGWSLRDTHIAAGTTSPLTPDTLAGQIIETRAPARVDDWSKANSELGRLIARRGIRSSVGVPIIVGGKLWGALVVATDGEEPLPNETEPRLGNFAELVGTAIATAESRERLRRLATEQAALRRLATLVAERTPSADLYTAVAEEVSQVLDVATVNLVRYDDGHAMTVLASLHNPAFPVGSTWPLEGDSLSSRVFYSGISVRIDDYSELPGPISEATRRSPVTSSVGVPIVVTGTVWGMLAIGGSEALQKDIEDQLRDFTELVAIAVSDASTRAELMASRARIVAAGDEARRRIERDLHDGTQQRLVALGLDLQAAIARIPPAAEETRVQLRQIGREVKAVLEDVREFSRGLHPGLLSQSGLRSSLKALARKSPIPVDVIVEIERRPPEAIEIAVYYVVSEALANVAKYADASEATVTVTTSDTVIRATIEDNGRGGAEASSGSGLIGLIDRVEALGGRFVLDSPPGRGTKIAIELPLDAPAAAEVKPRLEPTRIAEAPPVAGRQLSQVVDADTLLVAIGAVADALYIVDPQGRIRFANPAALRILGYEAESQLLGRPSHDTIHHLRPDGTPFPAADCPMLRPRVTGETIRVDDDWFVRQDGSFVPVSYSSAPLTLPGGRGAVVAFRERTELRPGSS